MRFRKVPCSLVVVAGWLLLASAPATASVGSVGVYFDPQGTICQGTITPGVPGTLYVIAKVGGTGGMTGAEFRFTQMPLSWHAYPVPNPEILALGDPFANGTLLAFPACQNPPDGIVLLYTVLVLADAVEPDVRFAIETRSPPSNPRFACPLLVNCPTDAAYTSACTEPVACWVNSLRQLPCMKPFAVLAGSWSAVKGMYR